jgi:tetratricopeptide (TPR) repeat protein
MATDHEQWADRMRALGDMRRWADLERATADALTEYPDDIWFLSWRALCFNERKLYAEALEVGDLLLVHGPDQEWTHRLRAIALRGLKRLDEALIAAQEARRLAPRGWRGHLVLGQVLVAKGEYAAAHAVLQDGARLAPDDPHFPYQAGLALTRLNRRGAARASYRQALSIDPRFGPARNNLLELAPWPHRRLAAARVYALLLRSHPSVEVLTVNLRGQLLGIVWRALAITIIGLAAADALSREGFGAGLSAVAATAASAGYLGASWWRLGGPLRGLARTMLRRDRLAYAGLLLTAVGTVGAWLAGTGATGTVATTVVLIALICCYAARRIVDRIGTRRRLTRPLD